MQCCWYFFSQILTGVRWLKKKRSFLIQLSPLNCLNINCVTENYHKHNVKIASLFQVLIDIEEKETSLNIIVRSLQLLLDYLTQYPKQPSMLWLIEDVWGCHAVVKLISKVYNRERIVRDCVHHHHFKNGRGSCKDYW